jgi:anion-transporting  ArsA/GET3 family ATPase
VTVGELAMSRGLVVCVGTGGVGKTTMAAAIGLGAALRGRRVAVLTIDPAHQLARSLGLDDLSSGGQPVPAAALAAAGLELTGSLDAGMLDQKRAWDAFINRLIADPSRRDRVLANPFYQQLSSSFPGSNEYMAIEEVCRLAESGRYELVVLDTPPATHALEFLRAPERIERLLDGSIFGWLARPYGAGRAAWRSLGRAADWVVSKLERAAGQRSLREISDFLVALQARAGELAARSRQARALLLGPGTAFVLVARPQELILDETSALVDQLAELGTPLSALVANRVHVRPAIAGDDVDRALASVDESSATWIRWAWSDAVGESRHEQVLLDRLMALLPPTAVRADIPEGDRDVHGIRQLADLADALWAP